MVIVGFALSSEEHGPVDLVRQASMAERAGFGALSISDHYHPWVPRQGHSPFVWSVLGGIASVTSTIPVVTGVTCPTMRIHPAIIAQAAATAASMFEGRFSLGLGSGEALNEHILGDPWPSPATRLDMLREAIGVMRQLWTGDECDIEGEFYTVRSARLFTLPDEPPPVVIAAAGPLAAELAADNDGLMSTAPDSRLVQTFNEHGGSGMRAAHVTLAWAPTPEEARERAIEYWPTAALSGPLHSEVPTPALYEQIVEGIDDESLAAAVTHGSTPEPFLADIAEYVAAGFTHLFLHPVGPDVDGFFGFWKAELQPALRAQFGSLGRAA